MKTITVTVNYFRASNGQLMKTFTREQTTYKHTINSLQKMYGYNIKGNGIDKINVYLAEY